MRTIRFQNKVATSSFTLPVAALVATLLWFITGDFTMENLAGWVGCGLTAFLLVEFNNAHALIRIRSRLTSAIYLINMGCFSFLHPFQEATWSSFFLLASLHFLFKSYQQSHAAQKTYHIFFFLGMASLAEPRLIWLVPLYYWSMTAYMRSLNFKSFWAGISGAITPLWFALGYGLYQNDLSFLVNYGRQVGDFSPLSWEILSATDTAYGHALLPLILWGILASLHTLRTSYNDKIRTRMHFYILILFSLVFGMALLLQPHLFPVLFSSLLLTTAPVIAHFFALTHTKITNILFIIYIIMYLFLAFYNIWNNF